MEMGVGHVHNIQDTFQATAGGTYSVTGGYVRTNANMNMSLVLVIILVLKQDIQFQFVLKIHLQCPMFYVMALEGSSC